MKKFFLFISLIFFLLFTGCTTSMLYSMMGPPVGYGYKSNVSPIYGYEVFKWGTNFEAIEKSGWDLAECGKSRIDFAFEQKRSAYKIKSEKKMRNGAYFIGHYTKGWGINNYYEDYIPHGDKDSYVNKTLLYFNDNRLYAAEDEFNEKSTLDFLHQRYGSFSEENIVTFQQRKEGIETVYRGHNYLESGEFHAIEIIIYESGKTKVKLREPFFEKSKQEGNPLNNWICYSAFDTQNKRINFTFINKNNDNKYLFVGYSKGYESSNISYVRAGICWGDKASGLYDIKGDSNVLSRNYSTEKWKCFFNNQEYVYTNNVTESSREILELFLSEEILVRHNNTISKFDSTGKSLLDKMAEYGIFWEEIDNALTNEEF